MTIEIIIKGETAQDVLLHLKGLVQSNTITSPATGAARSDTPPDIAEAEPETKTRKPRTSKAEKAEAAEKAPTEAPKYTLQEALDYAKNAIGDGEDEVIVKKLQALNGRFGITKVRELPSDKIDGYVAELKKTFPITEETAAPTGGIF